MTDIEERVASALRHAREQDTSWRNHNAEVHYAINDVDRLRASVLISALRDDGLDIVDWPEEQEKLRLLVDSYERKGAQQERDRLRKQVQMLPFGYTTQFAEPHPWVYLSAVLALLADPEEPSDD